MNTPVISIIIPVYNAAQYVEQCITSVLQQTLQSIEVIAINDGSIDDSAAILNRLAAADHRLRVFHQQNKGVSAARNFGLEQAQGTYIGFCDADDWMEPNMLEVLYNRLLETKSQWSICNVFVVKDGKTPTERLQLVNEVIDTGDKKADMVHSLMQFRYDNANWNKLFSGAIIREQQLRFAEDMRIWEDLLFNLQYLHFVDRVAVIAQPLYQYRILTTALYSGQRTALLPQFNLLYSHYLAYDGKQTRTAMSDAFKVEMARIAYSELLYKAQAQVKKENSGFVAVWRAYAAELKEFNPAIFYYPIARGALMRGFKKQLLQNRQFGLFAFLVAMKVSLFNK